MSEVQPKPGSMSLALLAGAVVLCTGPATLGLLVMLVSRGSQSAFDGVANLVMEGGSSSYAVLFSGALASLAGAALAALSVRRPGLPPPFALIPFLLPMLAALGGVASGMREVTAALANVNPADKATILMAATAELTATCVQALAFAAAGALAVALATVVTLSAPVRAARVMTVLGAGTLGLSLGLMALQDAAIRASFSAMAMVSPLDRATLLGGVIEDWQRLNHLSATALLASLVVTVVGAAWVARSDRAVALGTGAVLLVAGVGFRGFNVLTERQLAATVPGALRSPLMRVQGHPPSRSDAAALADPTPGAVDDEVLQHARRVDTERPWLAVELGAGLAPNTLLRALQTAHFVRVNVELVGDAPKVKREVPPLFNAAVVVVGELRSAAPVRIAFTGEPCDGCKVATLSEAGLVLESETWKLEPMSPTGAVDALPGVEVAWPGDLASLVRASLTALSHQHLLVVRVPPPQPEPVLPEL